MTREEKHIAVVLGMHRSGTSALTRGLTVLGFSLGDNLMPPSPSQNAKGFWEDQDIVALNDDLLGAIGREWHSVVPVSAVELRGPTAEGYKLRAASLMRAKLAAVNLLGIKDPRFARLLPIWREVFDGVASKVSYLIAFRNPLSVARSLSERNAFPAKKSHLLWLDHMLSSLVHSRGAGRLVVDYDMLIDAPATQLNRIAARLGLPFDPGSQAFIEYREHFLEEGLRHTRFRPEDLSSDRDLPGEVVELHGALLDLANDRFDFDDARLVALLKRLQEGMT